MMRRLGRHRRGVLLVVAAAGVTVAVVGIAAARSDGIPAAPAFDAQQLAAPPATDWITNGGSISNDRYSTESQINTGNVHGLKGIWHIHLKSGVGEKYSGEATPLEYGGVIYIVTGADDVFAVDAKTGAVQWSYSAHLDPKISDACCGWSSRGVALGDGRVYVAQLDDKLVALDQQTGKVDWTANVASWHDGYTITAAPLYYDGRVYTGISGGEYRTRGRLTAYDAATGKLLWRFYTIPGPGQVGHDTWPATGDAWKHGGATVWQTPAVDPQLGLLYFSTGNAGPDVDGRTRAGDNLFTSSILAIDAKTGAYRWHFQEVHHDLWDYDAPSPVVLYDVVVHGRLRHALGQPGKTGWLYLLDRETGKPLFGITEKPVPQNPAQNTAKTQPFPSNPPFVPHTVSPAELEAIKHAAPLPFAPGPMPTSAKIVPSPIFTAPAKGTLPAVAPGPSGGANWSPTSYNPDTHMFYVCALASASAITYGSEPPDLKPGGVDFGSVPAATGYGTSQGTLTGIDGRSGRIVWQRRWPDSCYAGTVTTAGNLVFAGRNGGELQAFDARTGKPLWSFQTGSGANSPAAVFSLDGHEVVTYYAAGSSLVGNTHGDDLWLFGLDGTLGPVPAGGAPRSASAQQPGASSGPVAKTSTVNVAMGEFYFRLSTGAVHRGTITFKLANKGTIGHDFSIAGKTSPVIPPGHTGTLTVTFAKAGTYPYRCTIPGHAAAGMKGTLRVV